MTFCEAQPCADIISANSLHEASQTAAYLQVDDSDNLAPQTALEIQSTYVSLLNAGLAIFRCFRHWSPYASTMLGPQNLFGDMNEKTDFRKCLVDLQEWSFKGWGLIKRVQPS